MDIQNKNLKLESISFFIIFMNLDISTSNITSKISYLLVLGDTPFTNYSSPFFLKSVLLPKANRANKKTPPTKKGPSV